MIKILEFNKIMQKDIKEFIVENINNELNIQDMKILFEVTKDLENIEESYINSGGELLFAYDTNNKKIAGTIAIKFEKNIAILKRFYVNEKYRKKKIGYLLYSNLEEKIKQMKIEKIYLTTGNKLKTAHKFYEQNGWFKTENNPGIYVRKDANLYKKEMEVKNMKGDVLKQADILIEAIPYIKEYVGKIIVIKYGGNAMNNDEQKKNIMKQISLLKMLGIKIILVHGGGPDIEKELKNKKIETKFENGLRVTDETTVDIVKMVLIGKTNSEIVKLLNMENCNAVGLSGLDNNFIECSKIDEKLRFVGKIENIDKKLVLKLLEEDFIPVISSIGGDKAGNVYNINADTVASEIAIELKAKKIIFLTNTDGIFDKNKKIISLIENKMINNLIEDGTISGGMIPKIKACKKCLDNGVERTHILNGTINNTIIYELLSDNGIGTMLV